MVPGRLLRGQRSARGGVLPGPDPGRAGSAHVSLRGLPRRHDRVRPLPPARLGLARHPRHLAARRSARPGVLVPARAALAPWGLDRPRRGDLRLSRPGTAAPAQVSTRLMPRLDSGQVRTLVWAGLAVVLAGWNGSILVLELPAVANTFGARVSDLSNLGSIVIFGAFGAWPLATLADHFGRRRLIAVGTGLFSLVSFLTAFAPNLTALALLRLAASCFESLVLAVGTALIVEEAPAGRRGLAVSALALLFGAGQGIPVIVYPFVAPDWR